MLWKMVEGRAFPYICLGEGVLLVPCPIVLLVYSTTCPVKEVKHERYARSGFSVSLA